MDANKSAELLLKIEENTPDFYLQRCVEIRRKLELASCDNAQEVIQMLETFFSVEATHFIEAIKHMNLDYQVSDQVMGGIKAACEKAMSELMAKIVDNPEDYTTGVHEVYSDNSKMN